MKKIFALLLAVLVALSCTVAAAAADPSSTYPSPTAPTIIPPNPDEPPTGNQPTSPTGTTAPGGTTTPGVTDTTVTKPTGPSGTSGTSGPSGLSTTPDGSTVTGTAKPDKNPDSPKTGDMTAEVFLFSAIAMTGAGALVLLRKKKDEQ